MPFKNLNLLRILSWIALVWVGVFGLSCIGIPIAALMMRALSNWKAIHLFDPSLLAITKATLWQALLSTVISIAIGLPIGLFVGREAAEGKSISFWTRIILAIPYGVPTIVVGLVGITWLGRSGILAKSGLLLDWAYSLKAVIVMHVLLNAPWIALLVSQSRGQIPQKQIEAARTLGAGKFNQLRWIVWPFVKWALAIGTVQVFSLCVMSFALVLILGGGPPVQTLETALFTSLRYGAVDITGAMGCAVWELLITLLPWMILLVIHSAKKKTFTVVAPQLVGRTSLGSYAVFFLIFSITVVPYLVLFEGGLWNVLGKADVLSEIMAPLRLSLKLAIGASLGAISVAVAGVLVSEKFTKLRSVIAILLSLPSGISMLVLGLGFWLAYQKWIDPFEGSGLAMILLQVTLFSPLAFRMLWAVAQGTQKRLLEAAYTLGASQLRAFWVVEWPRWKEPLVSVAAIVAAASLGEVAAVSLFYSERLIPLPLLISRWMGQYRFEEARAVAALLLVLSTGTISVVSLWSGIKKKYYYG